jgi:hypothetical protein
LPIEPERDDNAELVDKDFPSAEGFATHVHEYLRDYIELADKKAAFVFAAVSAFLAYLQTKDAALRWWRDPRTWGLADVLSITVTVLLLLADLMAYLTVAPRLGGPKAPLVYWGAIVQLRAPSDYAREIAALGPQGRIQALLEHSHDLARVCDAKYQNLSLAMRLGALGLLLGLFYVATTGAK